MKFYKVVQNKMHYAAHGHTAAEIEFMRADGNKPFAGLKSFAFCGTSFPCIANCNMEFFKSCAFILLFSFTLTLGFRLPPAEKVYFKPFETIFYLPIVIFNIFPKCMVWRPAFVKIFI